MQHQWKALQPGDAVGIIAPSGSFSPEALDHIKNNLQSWGLKAVMAPDILKPDLLSANTDEKRFEGLKEALFDPTIKVIWCVRGGYGCTRLIPSLKQLPTPPNPKLLIGFSDITALHLFVGQEWGWPSLHGPSANQAATQAVDSTSIALTKDILFGRQTQVAYGPLAPLNKAASPSSQIIEGPVVGGNLSLVQASLGTPWQIRTANRLLILEDVNERGYRVDRKLQHLKQAGVFDEASGVVFGDFTEGLEPDGSSLIEPVLTNFAQGLSIPVFRYSSFGHGVINYPIPLGTPATLSLSAAELTISTGVNHG